MTERPRKLLESGIMLLGLMAFWPWILGYRAIEYQIGLLVVLALLGGLAVVRARRVRRALSAMTGFPALGGNNRRSEAR